MTRQGEALLAIIQEDRSRRITREGLTALTDALNVLGLPLEDCNAITAALGYTPGLFEALT